MPKITPELKKYLESEGYTGIREIEGRGIYGVHRFIFTTAIVYGIDETGYKSRWCYPHSLIMELAIAYSKWDGIGDPEGNWIKHKGYMEYSNPNLILEK
jgi:hypothetical protein